MKLVIKQSVEQNVEFSQAQKAFIERGLASRTAAKESGKYVSSAKLPSKLARRLEKARRG